MIDPMNNPDHWQNPKRQAATLELLKAASPRGPVLDIGESPFSRVIEQEIGHTISSTKHDLDRGVIEGKWGTMLCFEVLEHLGNPLYLLDQMRAALEEDGRIWLSTPLIARWRPDSFRASNHVFEFSWPQLEFLLHKAELEVVSRTVILYRPWWQYFRGPRPILRLFSDRCVILQLRRV